MTTRSRPWGDTAPERELGAALLAAGLKDWHTQDENLPGRPDFVFPGERVAVFVHGCFWHGCPAHWRLPRSRPEFWRRKRAVNTVRDRAVSSRLRAAGWKVVTVWSHDVQFGIKLLLSILDVIKKR